MGLPRLQNATGAWLKRPARNLASVTVALVNQIRDPETVESNSFAGCPDMGNGFRRRLFPVLARRFCLGKGFKRASDDMFG